MGSNQIAVIDFSNGWLKVAQAQAGAASGTGAPFVSAAEFTVEADNKLSRKEFSSLLWAILKTRPKAVYSCFPRHYATVRFLKLPSADAGEIASMVEFQAEKQLPFSKEDMVTGFKILSTDTDGFSRVMLAVAQKNAVDSHLSILKSAGIMPKAICLSTEALFGWFMSTQAAKLVMDSALYLLVDIDASFTELLICEKSEILFTRSFEHGAGPVYKLDINGPAVRVWVDALKEHLRLSYLAYKKENAAQDKKVQKIFISGGAVKLFARIKEELEKEFNVAVEFCGKKDGNFADKPLSLSKAIGIVRAPEKMSINLIPQELKTSRLHKQKKDDLVRFYVLSATAFLCLFTLIGSRFLYKKMYLNYLNAQLQELRPYADKAEIMADKLKIVYRQSEKNSAPLEILRQLYSVMPGDINISNFSLSDSRVLMLRGYSKSMSRVFQTVQALEGSAYFKKAKVIFTDKRKVGQEEIIDFQISCVLE